MSRQAPDLDRYPGQTDEPYVEQYDYQEPELDPQEDRRARYGGTDLFRGVIVVLLALAVGGFLATRSLDAPGSGTSDETAADTVDESDLDPAAPSTDDADGATDDADGATDDSAVDDAMTDEPATDAADSTDPMADTTDDTATTSTTEPAPTTEAVRAPAEVTVQVLNATDRKGIAAQGTDLLALAGYSTDDAGNALNAQPSAIFYAQGFEAEALAVAQTLGTGLETLVKPLDPTVSLSEDPVTADVVVVLGTDDVIPL